MRTLFVCVWLSAGGALASEEAPTRPELEADERLELGLRVGYAWGVDSEALVHHGAGARVQLLVPIVSHISLGPELALYAHAGSRIHINGAPGGDETGSLRNEALLQVGGVMRAQVRGGGVRPALLVGLGWCRGESSVLAYSVGAELEVLLGERLPLVFDARYLDNIQRYPNQHYFTLGLGTRLPW